MPLVPRKLTEHAVRRVISHYDRCAFAEAATHGLKLRRGQLGTSWLPQVVAYKQPPRAPARLRRYLEIVEVALVAEHALTLLREKLDNLSDESRTPTAER